MSSLFGGSSPELNSLIGQFSQVGGNLTGTGQKYTNQAGNFWSSLLSGDATKQMSMLSPEISAAKTSAANQNKTDAMFGNRSGGTAAHTAATNDTLHGYITNLLGSLTGSAASNLGSLGTSMTSEGLGALGQEQGAVAERMRNWSNSILGKGITGAVSAAESAGIGAGVGALPGGVGAGAGAAGALGIGPAAPGAYYGGGVPQAPTSFFDSLFQSPASA